MKDERKEFIIKGNDRASIIEFSGLENVPFEIKRVCYMQGRFSSFHAHKDLQQVFICVSGSCDVLLDDGKEKQTYSLNKPFQGLFVDKLIWSEMNNFSSDCVLMALASEYYDEEDYIWDYEDFLSYIKFKNKSKKKYFSHEKAIVESEEIGSNTTIWAFSHVLPKAKIGENCNLNDHTFIENDVVLGNNVTVKSGVHIWDGITIEDNVFIGPSVVFTNDLNPRSKRYPIEFAKTVIKKFASIGANSTIVAGNTIGEYAMVGAGSVVTKDIPPYTLWYGNPAEFKGYVCECGMKLSKDLICESCNKNYGEIVSTQ